MNLRLDGACGVDGIVPFMSSLPVFLQNLMMTLTRLVLHGNPPWGICRARSDISYNW